MTTIFDKKILLIIIGLLVVGFVGFYFRGKPVASQPIVASEKIDNWKTYTNTKYNYSIRLPSSYPDNSEAKIDQSSGELDLKMVTSSVWVAVWKNSGNLTTDEWLKKNGNMTGKNTYPAQKTAFNGYDALVSNRGSNGEQASNWYFISHGNYIYQVEDNETVGAAPTFKPTQQQIQDQKEILSTFKFLDNQVSQQKAIELVRNQKDVQVWLALFSGPGQTSPKTGGRPVIAFDHMDGNRYIIHVFEDLPDHTATFNWFEVDSETGAVTRTFNF